MNVRCPNCLAIVVMKDTTYNVVYGNDMNQSPLPPEKEKPKCHVCGKVLFENPLKGIFNDKSESE